MGHAMLLSVYTTSNIYIYIYIYIYIILYIIYRHKGVQKPQGMASEVAYRPENRCESSGARPGPFPGPPGARLGREAAQNRRLPALPPPTTKKMTSLEPISAPSEQKESNMGPGRVDARSAWSIAHPFPATLDVAAVWEL
jgi:hypothetical protein